MYGDHPTAFIVTQDKERGFRGGGFGGCAVIGDKALSAAQFPGEVYASLETFSAKVGRGRTRE